YDQIQDQDRLAGGRGYGVEIANSIRPAVQTDQTGVFRSQVTKSQITSVHSRNSATGEIIMTTHSSNRLDLVTRRKFLGTTAAGSAALLTGGLTSLLRESASAVGDFDFIEKTIPQLQTAMASGQFTSRELTQGYIDRIQSLNPLLHSVIEVNPNAVAIAAGLDNERRNGQVRGPLHGIPLLVKDNIATNDQMQTTAGSLALFGSQVPADAPLIQNLRAAGAIILGKANLGEWANFRDDEAETFPLAVGWSARGGSTNNAYDLSYTSWGSSAGSANGAAANL